MSVAAPPAYVVWRVEQAAPGFWSVFVERANRALRGLDVSLSSWYRTDSVNQRVGGAAQSQHLIGTAFDLVGRDAWAASTYLTREGFIVVQYGDGHIHAQAWPAGAAARAGLL